MLAMTLAAAVAWTTTPLDLAWARLAHDAAVRDRSAFAADRNKIVMLTEALLQTWQLKVRESYTAPAYGAVTYNGPATVRGDRSRSAYFAVVKPKGDFDAPSFWELTPGYSPPGKTWFLSANSCNLQTGDPMAGQPRHWTTKSVNDPPSYAAFKTALAKMAGTPGAFPSNTYVSHSPGTVCLDVGGLSRQPLGPAR